MKIITYILISFLIASCTAYPRSEFLITNSLEEDVIVEINYDDGNVRRYVAPSESRTLIYANYRYEGSIQITLLAEDNQIGNWSNYFTPSRSVRCNIDIPLKNAVNCTSKFPIGFSLFDAGTDSSNAPADKA